MKKNIVIQSIKRLFASIGFLLGLGIMLALFVAIYLAGYYHGALSKQIGVIATYNDYDLSYYANKLVTAANIVVAQPTLAPPPPQQTEVQEVSSDDTSLGWGGPDLWEAVNKRRAELGVRTLQLNDELCTLASIRLNDQLAIQTLDGHEGFNNLAERRPDLVPILNNFSHLAEFLALGGDTPQRTVEMWEGSLGHQKLLNNPDYVYGCIYAQQTYAVALTAY